jgi:crotonobetainyl-CoA:carnitine CoA-transferase CaiB-like acyl-CoA transferase
MVAAEAVRLNGKELFYESRINQEAGLTVKHRHVVFGDLEQPGNYWHMGETRLVLGPPPPGLGEHTREICTQFGMPEDAYERIEAAGHLLGMPGGSG